MIPFKATDHVLEVGGGSQPKFRPNLDIRALVEVDIVCELGDLWPVADDVFDGVYSSYAIEHVSWRKLPHVVSDIFRVLKPSGRAYIVTANTEAQMRWALQQDEIGDKVGQCLFGDLDYAENSHKAALSPRYVMRIFREAGFQDVLVMRHGEFGTDMIIEAKKSAKEEFTPVPIKGAPVSESLLLDRSSAANWTHEERKRAYNRHYFDGGRGGVGGYTGEGYRDFPVHWTTFAKLMEYKPESVLELGCGRGYLLKRFQDAGIPAEGLEVSRHCYLTRACDGVVEWDLTQTPWPFKSKQFDLVYSMATLEHIPEQHVEQVLREAIRVSKRGVHGIDFGAHDDGQDKTHCSLRPLPFWIHKLTQAYYPASDVHQSMTQSRACVDSQELLDKEELERGPIRLPPGDLPPGDGKLKLNLGCHTVMFHHGWKNIDFGNKDFLKGFAEKNGYEFVHHDLRRGMDLRDVDLIVMSHVLEHFTYEEGLELLKECRRAMKSGATMRIAVPDARRLAELMAYHTGDPEGGGLAQFNEISDSCAASRHDAGKFWSLLFDGHQAAYDKFALQDALQGAGFSLANIRECLFREGHAQIQRETQDMFPDLSLYVEVTA